MATVDLSYGQSTALAVIQGFTEFLPISSSAHLILPRILLDWPEQGVAFDVVVHLGTLLAVILYFREEIMQLLSAWLWSLKQTASVGTRWIYKTEMGEQLQRAKFAWYLIVATIPAGSVGLLWQSSILSFGREGAVLAISSIVFGVVLLLADRLSAKKMVLKEMRWRSALLIGLAQVFALIPGTSRSGVTMSAALMLGFNRTAATKFSFLMAIPIIAATSLLEIGVLISIGTDATMWMQLFAALLVAAGVAYACIHFFLQLIAKIGFMPFVIYRILLGIFVLVIAAS